MGWIKKTLILFLMIYSAHTFSNIIEINGSPFATENAPLPQYIKPPLEKLILVNPRNHAWGAYSAQGKLIRWGLATAGADWCRDLKRGCRTKTGQFRIYSLGNENCISYKFPIEEGGGAPMPYCMYFNGSEAIHGSNEVAYENKSHGCVRIHIDDAKWLRFHFVEAPSMRNNYKGTRVAVLNY